MSDQSQRDQSQSQKGFRSFRVPMIVISVVVAGSLALWFVPGMERMLRVVFTGLLLVLAGLLLSGWFVFFSRYSRKTRMRGAVALVVLIVSFFVLVRPKEFSGDIVPTLTWRWSPERDRTLEKLPTGAVESVQGQPAPDFPRRSGGEDFSRFLGEAGNGEVRTALRFESDLVKFPPKEIWKKPIGAGWSGFAVIGPYAVTQEQRDTEECVSCYEKLTGKVCWSSAQKVRFSEALGGVGPRATPTIHEGKVYAIGATGILSCLEGSSGKLLWSRDTLTEFRQTTLDWAKSSSPVISGNRVIVSLQKSPEGSNRETSFLAAYDLNDGKPVWSAVGDKASYATPRTGRLSGIEQILSVNAESVTGHETETGKELWRFVWPGEQPKCSDPVPLAGDRVLISAGYGLGGVLLQVSQDAGGGWQIVKKWESRQLKTRFMNSVLREGLIYALDDGILCCVDLETGKTRWRKGRYGHGQILLVNDLLFIVAENGDLAVVEASGEKYSEHSRVPALNGKTWNTLALSGRLLLMRNAEEAICYELPVK